MTKEEIISYLENEVHRAKYFDIEYIDSIKLLVLEDVLNELKKTHEGYWKSDSTDNRRKYCSACNSPRRVWFNRMHAYCPDCGARMLNVDDQGVDKQFPVDSTSFPYKQP